MNSRKAFILITLVTLVAGFSIGCDEDTTAPDLGVGAKLRVIHSSPDAPPVDIYAEGVTSPLVSDLEYGETSDYLDLEAGTYNIQIRGAGDDPSSTPVYETGDLNISDGAKISALAAGLLGSSDSEKKFRVIPLAEGFTDPGSGKAAVRIIHGSADAPTVAIDVGNDASFQILDFDRFDDTGVTGVPLDSGTALQIAIWAGTPLARVTVFTTPALPEGGEIFVIATGLLDKLPRETDGFKLMAVGPSGTIGMIAQNPVVFALHASPNVEAVDIYESSTSTLLIENLDFGDLSDPVQVPPGAYTLDFTATGSPTTVASATTPSISAGERYLAIASGFLSGSPGFQLIPVGDGFTLGSNDALVRVVHASPDAPAVDIGTVSEGVLSPVDPDYVNIDFTESSLVAGTSLPIDQLNIGVAETGTTDPLVTFTLSTAVGMRVLAVAAGSVDSPPVGGNGFRLILVDTGSFPWIATEVMPD